MANPLLLLTRIKQACLILLSLFLFNLRLHAEPQDSSTVTADRAFLTAGDLATKEALDLGQLFWKYRSGDDLDWANPVFADSGWTSLRSDFNPDSLAEGVWNGIGWFRLLLEVDSTLHNTTLALSVYHIGASEIYLDGIRIGSFGKIGTSGREDQFFSPKGLPIGLHLDERSHHLLAVRYSNRGLSVDLSRRLVDVRDLHPIGFAFLVAPLENRVHRYIYTATTWFTSGIFIAVLLLTLTLHSMLYLFGQRERANLYFSLSMLFGVVGFYMSGELNHNVLGAATFPAWPLYAQDVGVVLMYLFFTAVLYTLYYSRLPKSFWILVCLAAICLIATFLVANVIWLFYLIALVEALRVTGLAIRKKMDGAWILGSGVLVPLLVVVVVIVFGIAVGGNRRLDIPENPTVMIPGQSVVALAVLSMPLAMSVLLARRFTRTSKRLEKELVRVKQLSEKTLQQELKRVELEAENERKSAELEEARQLQLSMLPKEVPQVPGLKIVVYMKTATEVGGDYYDFHVAEDGTLTVVVGDATGHGLKAGTMVTTAKSLFSTLAEYPDIASTFQQMSKSIKAMNLPLLSMCLTMLKISHGSMKVSSAGIPPTLIYRTSTKSLEEVSIGGMPLGAMAGFPYREKVVALAPGDTILLMSDGFPERMNERDEMLDYTRAHSAFAEVASESPQEIVEHLVETGVEWANGRSQDDDVTFVVIRVGGTSCAE